MKLVKNQDYQLFSEEWAEVIQKTTDKANEILHKNHPDLSIQSFQTGIVLLAFLSEFQGVKINGRLAA